jgi:hypothetical protein
MEKLEVWLNREVATQSSLACTHAMHERLEEADCEIALQYKILAGRLSTCYSGLYGVRSRYNGLSARSTEYLTSLLDIVGPDRGA